MTQNPAAIRACERRDCTADPAGKTAEYVYRPLMDQYEFDDRYEIHVDVPGSSDEAIGLTVHERVLTLDAGVARDAENDRHLLVSEYGVGPYRRKIHLGEDIDADALSARYADGVLVVSLPKRAERRPRRIAIAGA